MNSLSFSTEPQILTFSPEQLGLSVDWILQGQGMNPPTVRQRRPALVSLAQQALQEGLPLLTPRAIIRTLPVTAISHTRLHLGDYGYLEGGSILEHLAPAQQVTILAFTIGSALEEKVFSLQGQNMVTALAWDGLANAAIDALGGLVYHSIENSIKFSKWQLSLSLSPGMAGWSVEEGQPQISRLINLEAIDIRFTQEWVMQPRKSSTSVVGAGANMVQLGSLPCDFCTMQGTCRYKGQLSHGKVVPSEIAQPAGLR